MRLYLIGGDVVPFAQLYLPLFALGLLVLAYQLRSQKRIAGLCLAGVAAMVLIAPWGHNCDDWPWWWAVLMGCF